MLFHDILRENEDFFKLFVIIEFLSTLKEHTEFSKTVRTMYLKLKFRKFLNQNIFHKISSLVELLKLHQILSTIFKNSSIKEFCLNTRQQELYIFFFLVTLTLDQHH